MKAKLTLKLIAASLLLLALDPQLSTFAQGTSFTYQGRLLDTGSPANGNYDMRFYLRDALSGGNPVGATNNLAPVAVSNGLFTVVLDFGSGIFTGAARWLEIAVRTNGSVSAYTVLSPREALTAVPYAITAGNLTGTLPASQLSGTLPSAQFSGTYSGAVTLNNAGNSFSGSGSGLTGVNALTLNGYGYCALPCYWNLSGNAGTVPGVNFVGTSDSQPLTFKVNNTTALQIMPGATLPNVVGGLAAFRPSVIASGVSGAVIAGGNAPSGGVNGFGGGDYQAVYDDDGTVGGGFGNKAGNGNTDVTDAAFATVAGGVFNSATAYGASVGGGDSNAAGGQRAAVGGGYANQAVGSLSFVGGGLLNTIQTNATYAVIGGGSNNVIQASAIHSTIGGGAGNTIKAGAFGTTAATIGGGAANTVTTNFAVVAGGLGNTAGGYGAFIGGGGSDGVWSIGNFASGAASVIGGGFSNTNSGRCSTVGGGVGNTVDGTESVIGGGAQNIAYAGSYGGTIGGGQDNRVSTGYATVGGGYFNQALGAHATVGGGNNNSVTNSYATIPGGSGNRAGGVGSLAAGIQAYALHEGTFVWADTYGLTPFASTSPCQFLIRAAGGVGINTNSPRAALHVVGNILATGTVTGGSDRNAKEHFAAVSPRAVLDQVAALPITRWNYKTEAGVTHVGPMAQDFYAAFHVGQDDTHISMVDADGVALAAIQGLNQKVEEREASVRAENAELRQEVAELKRLINQMNTKLNGGAQ